MNFITTFSPRTLSRKLTALTLIITSFILAAYAPMTSLTVYAAELDDSKKKLLDLVDTREGIIRPEIAKFKDVQKYWAEKKLNNGLVYIGTKEHVVDNVQVGAFIITAELHLKNLAEIRTGINEAPDLNKLKDYELVLNSTYSLDFLISLELRMINYVASAEQAVQTSTETLNETQKQQENARLCYESLIKTSVNSSPSAQPQANNGSPTVTIELVDPKQAIVNEGAAGDITKVKFKATRSGNSSGVISFDWSLGYAGSNQNVTPRFPNTGREGSITFSTGDTAVKSFEVDVVGDNTAPLNNDDVNTKYGLNIRNIKPTSGVTINYRDTTNFTIYDNDPRPGSSPSASSNSSPSVATATTTDPCEGVDWNKVRQYFSDNGLPVTQTANNGGNGSNSTPADNGGNNGGTGGNANGANAAADGVGSGIAQAANGQAQQGVDTQTPAVPVQLGPIAARVTPVVENVRDMVNNGIASIGEGTKQSILAGAQALAGLVDGATQAATNIVNGISNAVSFLATAADNMFAILRNLGKMVIDNARFATYDWNANQPQNRKGSYASDFTSAGVNRGTDDPFSRWTAKGFFRSALKCDLDVDSKNLDSNAQSKGIQLYNICKSQLHPINLQTGPTWHWPPVQIKVVPAGYKDAKVDGLTDGKWCSTDTKQSNVALSKPEIGRIYVCGAGYLTKGDADNGLVADLGFIVAEMTRMTQNYRNSDKLGADQKWIVDAIPEYVRYALNYGSSNTTLKCANQNDSYDKSALCGAAFLKILVKASSDTNLVKKVHLAATNGQFKDSIILEATGNTFASIKELFENICLNTTECTISPKL